MMLHNHLSTKLMLVVSVRGKQINPLALQWKKAAENHFAITFNPLRTIEEPTNCPACESLALDLMLRCIYLCNQKQSGEKGQCMLLTFQA